MKLALFGLLILFLWLWAIQFLFSAAPWFKALPLHLGFPLFFAILATAVLLPVMLVVWVGERMDGTNP